MREGDEPFRKARENKTVCREYIIFRLFVCFCIREVSVREQRAERREADTQEKEQAQETVNPQLN